MLFSLRTERRKAGVRRDVDRSNIDDGTCGRKWAAPGNMAVSKSGFKNLSYIAQVTAIWCPILRAKPVVASE